MALKNPSQPPISLLIHLCAYLSENKPIGRRSTYTKFCSLPSRSCRNFSIIKIADEVGMSHKRVFCEFYFTFVKLPHAITTKYHSFFLAISQTRFRLTDFIRRYLTFPHVRSLLIKLWERSRGVHTVDMNKKRIGQEW